MLAVTAWRTLPTRLPQKGARIERRNQREKPKHHEGGYAGRRPWQRYCYKNRD
jgi:hypothetical protein